ncbi:MAG: 1,4-alpha-glucan branching enzyme, partial [Streptomyces sp.]|nr:1,4-alpha-glucan branching enzyme [Streptomyces sp.]
MDFIFTLHSHLPYVLNHGRWPHGSDWLCEATFDTYLPLLEALRRLGDEQTPAPVTIGFTPVLANQLASPLFVREMDAFFVQRLTACVEAPASLAKTGESHLLPLVEFWRERLERLRALFHGVGGDLIGAFRALEAAGRIEIIGSAATHGFLPLLARDESIRLQLAVGAAEHRRLFGRAPTGCWLPECAYRPRGPWAPWPSAPRSGMRRGIEEHLSDAGFRYFFVDAHLASAGRPLGLSGDPAALDPEVHQPAVSTPIEPGLRSPYQAYRVAHTRGAADVSAYVRDPRASMQVWSRSEGYPGDGVYLEFHKMRWPGGLKLWRVSGPGVDLGAKEPYNPALALDRARGHAEHFAGLLAGIARAEGQRRDGVIVAPFDTELFGHWWFEGPDFL